MKQKANRIGNDTAKGGFLVSVDLNDTRKASAGGKAGPSGSVSACTGLERASDRLDTDRTLHAAKMGKTDTRYATSS